MAVKVNILIAAAIIFLSPATLGQELHVLQVKGNVTTGAGKLVAPNDVLRPADKLRFSKNTDAVAVVSGRSGRFILRPGSEQEEGEFVAIVKDALIPGMKRLSSRSGTINNVVDIQTRFQGPVLLLDTMRLDISPAAFPMSTQAFFFIRYHYKGEQINKRLPYKGTMLLIPRQELYSVDGVPINPGEANDLKLCFLKNGEVHTLSDLDFVTPDLLQLKREVSVIMKTLEKKVAAGEALLYLQEFYGNVSETDFQAWIDRGRHP